MPIRGITLFVLAESIERVAQIFRIAKQIGLRPTLTCKMHYRAEPDLRLGRVAPTCTGVDGNHPDGVFRSTEVDSRCAGVSPILGSRHDFLPRDGVRGYYLNHQKPLETWRHR